EVFRVQNPNGKIIEILPSPWTAPKNQPDATIVSSDEAAKLITTVAGEKTLPYVKLNNGEITCPHCHIELVMDAIEQAIFLERECPSCKKHFMVVNDAAE